MRRLVLLLLVFAFLPLAVPIAAGGGSWMQPSDEYIRPGEEVSMVGYVQASADDLEQEWVAVLHGPHEPEGTALEVMVIGPVSIEATGLLGYLSHRVSVDFVLPSDLETGDYTVSLDSGTPGDFIGDLVGGWFPVGKPYEHPLWVEWALDDPKIADLPDDAVVAGPGFEVTAAELNAGIYPSQARSFMMDPSILASRGVVVRPTPELVAEPHESPRPVLDVEPVELPTSPTQQESMTPMNWWPLAVAGLGVLALASIPSRRVERDAETVGEEELVSTGG